jgi:hypothetical protein
VQGTVKSDVGNGKGEQHEKQARDGSGKVRATVNAVDMRIWAASCIAVLRVRLIEIAKDANISKPRPSWRR